jgi:hypothetical protein
MIVKAEGVRGRTVTNENLAGHHLRLSNKH